MALEALGERGGRRAAHCCFQEGHRPLDASSNRTFLRGDHGGASLCRGSGGGVRRGGGVVVYTSRGFAFFFCWEQVQSYQTWMSQAQANSGPAALLGWMAESALGCSLPSAGSEGATSPAPSATAGWRPPAWPGPPGCGRGASLGRWVLSLGGGLGSAGLQGTGQGPVSRPHAGPGGCQVTCESLPGLGTLGRPGALGPSCLAGPGCGLRPLPAIPGSARGPVGLPERLVAGLWFQASEACGWPLQLGL